MGSYPCIVSVRRLKIGYVYERSYGELSSYLFESSVLEFLTLIHGSKHLEMV